MLTFLMITLFAILFLQANNKSMFNFIGSYLSYINDINDINDGYTHKLSLAYLLGYIIFEGIIIYIIISYFQNIL